MPLSLHNLFLLLIFVFVGLCPAPMAAQDRPTPESITRDTLLARQLQDSSNIKAVAQEYEACLGLLDSAGALYERSLGKNSIMYAQLLLREGQCFNLMGLLDSALARTKAAMNILPLISGEKRALEAVAYFTLGTCYMQLQQYDEAILYEEKALSIWSVILKENHPTFPIVYNNIAVVYQMTGNYARALEYYEKALSISQKIYGEESYEVQLAYNNIGGIYAQQERFDEAVTYMKKAAEILVKMWGEQNPELADLYFRLATLLSDMGNSQDAIALAEKASGIRVSVFGEKHPQVADAYTQLGALRSVQKDYEAAIAFYEKSLAANGFQLNQFGHVLNLEYLVHTLEALGKTYAAMYREKAAPPLLNKARLYFLASAQAADTLRSKFSESSSRQALVQNSYAVYEDILKTDLLLFRQTDSLSYVREAYQYSSRVKSQLLYEALKEAKALHFAGIPDSLLQQEYDLRLNITAYEEKREALNNSAGPGEDADVLTVNAALFNLKADYEELKERFIKDYPAYYRLKYGQNPLSVAEIQRELLNPAQAILEYFAGDSSIFLFVLRPDTLVMEEVKKDFPLEDWVRTMRDNIYQNRTTGAAAYAEAAFSLYQKLIAPVKSWLPEQITIIPDGILGYLPFEALLTAKPERAVRFNTHPYLLKAYQISYCYSASLLREMKQGKPLKGPGASLLAVAPFYTGDTVSLANSFAYADNTRKELAPLEHSGEEVYRIGRLWKGDMLTGADATKTNFTQRAGNYRILHLATHGQADERIGDYSFLAFSKVKGSMENELLYVRDLYNLQLNADLVVLSACETGLGKLSRGEGIISLARAFAYAGAKSIVTTLWSVDDAKTKDLMVDFYRNLKKGMPKDVALRQAKLDYLADQPIPASTHPFYWAGFVLIGDMETLPFNPKN